MCRRLNLHSQPLAVQVSTCFAGCHDLCAIEKGGTSVHGDLHQTGEANTPAAGAPEDGAHGFGKGAVLGAADAELVAGGAADVDAPEAGAPMPTFPNRDAKGLEPFWPAVGVVS